MSRYLAILGTNHQIYSEAASVLYSELTIVVHPGYILSLKDSYSDSSAFEEPIKDVWRHDPLKGIGHTKRNGTRFYYTPVMDGLVEPHVFTRFRKIELQAKMSHDFRPFLYINQDYSFNSAAEDRACKRLRKTGLMKNFAKLLSNSPLLNELSILLDMHVVVTDVPYDFLLTRPGPEEMRRHCHLHRAAQERGAEIAVDTGMLDPFLELSNVQCFKFAFQKANYAKDGLSETFVEAAKDIKHQIECNWIPVKNS